MSTSSPSRPGRSVPDPVFAPQQATTTELATGLVNSLLEDPQRGWLSGAAVTGFPAHAWLIGGQVTHQRVERHRQPG